MRDPRTFERRSSRELGLYNDPFIDRVAKTLLPAVESYVSGGGHLHDDAFFDLYLAAMKSAYPNGVGPVAYLRPLVAAYEPEVGDAYELLDTTVRSASSASAPSVSHADARGTFEKRPHWSRLFLLRNSRISSLRDWKEILTRNAITGIEARAKRGDAFAYAVIEPKAPPVFVLVAKDDLAMQALVKRFAAAPSVHPGVLTD